MIGAVAPLLIFSLLSYAFSQSIAQSDSVMVVQPGDSVTLKCQIKSGLMEHIAWFKQTFGTKPLLMVSSLRHNMEGKPFDSFSKDFTETKRLTVNRTIKNLDLTFSKTEPDDFATYYCASVGYSEVYFGRGTLLFLKGSNPRDKSIVQEPVSESVQPGDSVTLNCTIHTETCEGEHRVYWFRHGAGESHPGILYTHGDRSGQCGKSPEAGSPTQSCVYHLPKRNLSLSDAGTYYCAVASCGEILFGNGTKLDIKNLKDDHVDTHLLIIFALTAILILSIIFNIFIYLRLKRKQCKHSSGSTKQKTSNARLSNEKVQVNSDNLNYAALRFTDRRSDRSWKQGRRQIDETACIYSGVNRRDRQ